MVQNLNLKIEFLLLKMYSGKLTHATIGSAGYDMHYCGIESITLMPGERKLIPTGVRLQLNPQQYAKIHPRSGLAWKYCIDVGAGLIDNDYHDEVKVLLINNGTESFTVEPDMRCAQIVFNTYDNVQEVAAINTINNHAGFGSTGL